MKKTLALLATMALATWTGTATASGSDTVRLATTTSTENSGLLGTLMPAFTRDTGYKVHVIAVGTGKALRMGRDGDVDVVMVHAPPAEARFVADGHGEQRHSVMYNDFVIVGPHKDPAGLTLAKSIKEAFKALADKQAPFISRGDDSGTHKKELSLWKTAGIAPQGRWYREAGQGMGKVLQIADETEGYTLTDRGTWLAYRDKSDLRVAFQGASSLHNPYGIIRVSENKYPDLNHKGAQALIDWITDQKGQSLIAEFRKHGELLFTPSASASAKR